MTREAHESKWMRRWCVAARDAGLSPTGIALVSLACLVTDVARSLVHLDPSYGFLRWNLFLAWIPLVLAYCLAWAAQREATLVAVPALTFAWVVFLPNAPYLVTDLVHLRASVSISSVVTLGLLSLAGLLIGIRSVQIVQRLVETAFGIRAGWLAVHVAVALIAVGIYLGRVLRWNSWNVLSHPRELVGSVFSDPSDPDRATTGLLGTIAFTLVFYLAYRFLTLAVAESRPRRQAGPTTPGVSSHRWFR